MYLMFYEYINCIDCRTKDTDILNDIKSLADVIKYYKDDLRDFKVIKVFKINGCEEISQEEVLKLINQYERGENNERFKV